MKKLFLAAILLCTTIAANASCYLACVNGQAWLITTDNAGNILTISPDGGCGGGLWLELITCASIARIPVGITPDAGTESTLNLYFNPSVQNPPTQAVINAVQADIKANNYGRVWVASEHLNANISGYLTTH